ncbi:MAG TPA: GatB/YqeY domain-containing protein [Candidatus Marinimicrobia bacterium]|nr:GatB/YqeY domain-containing protein [Candidatus Neomarinimicrobiota bacterium]HIB34042.1 GatB/YqeY domain-containing protein [Candidatus Neomarinimicrobiota bacterium]
MSLFERIQNDMYVAMKAGEKEKSNTLRTTLAKLKDKRIEKRDDLSEAEAIKVLQTLVKQRKESVELFEKGGRPELAASENGEIDILNSYLPQMISEDEIRNIVQTVIDEVGAVSMADLGKVMPQVMERGKGLIDGKTAQQFVREILG